MCLYIHKKFNPNVKYTDLATLQFYCVVRNSS